MTVLNSVFYRHILHVLGDDVSPSMSAAEYLRMAADWFSAEHPWQFLRRPCFLDLRASVQLTGATYTHSSRTLTKAGAFADWSYVAGDRFEATGGTGVDAQSYPVESRTDDDNIVLADDGLGADADGSIDVAGELPNDSIALPSDFMAFVGTRALRSRSTTIRRVEFAPYEVLTHQRSRSIEVDGDYTFLGCVTELPNLSSATSPGQTDPVLEIYPKSSATILQCFRGYYRARLVIDTSSDTAVVPLPSGRPALELALVKACRAFALGFEEGEEADKPSLEVLLRQLTQSDIWRAAKKQDGLQQPTLGPIRGGVGERLRSWGRRTLDSRVEGPT